ncbi:hypothetical protein [Oceanobacillus sp. E9]|uniref:hypothetical protein n=1 Tax=Oceanobacillus sp. E9 TaxID=1742575 RepID=UPI00143A0216|nr:hypothetical protein [Oceanobacillus sp. E9]
MEKFIVQRYDMWTPEDMQKDMNEKYENDYYPKEIKLGDYQDRVDSTIIYELEESE